MANRFVQKLSGYAALSSDELAVLQQVTSRPVAYRPRQDLIREGDRPGPVFAVLEGWAFRYKVLPSGSRQVLAFLMPGDACDLHGGLPAAMDHGMQTATAARVAVIPGDTMDELMGRHPGIARAMYIAQLADEGTLRAWIVGLGRRSSTERVGHLLLDLYVRGVRVGIVDGGEMELPLSQVVFADALGMTPVHLNRVLQEFRRSGAIELQRGMLRIRDLRALSFSSGFDENYLHRQLRVDPPPCVVDRGARSGRRGRR